MEKITLSIIIPTCNEQECIGRTLKSLLDMTHGRKDIEIIVSDAGKDLTGSIAAGFSVRVCRSAKGRAIQMNTGASVAAGPILYFLHADTLPPQTFADDIIGEVGSGKQAGCFQMQFDDPHWIMAFYGWFTRFPLTICRGGDQSLFITRPLFDAIGGFDRRMSVMEDIDIIERIQQREEFHILDGKVTTSARKYHINGMIRLQSLFGILHLMYASGYEQDDLTKFYRNNIA
jgi:rSAM/selenodomain-associated transferase 2